MELIQPDGIRIHNKRFNLGRQHAIDRRLVLCLFARRSKNQEFQRARRRVWTAWHLETPLAYPSPGYPDTEDVAGGWPLEQEGDCPWCKVRFCAATKGAVCPLCGEVIGLT
jgi:hypothetical protein